MKTGSLGITLLAIGGLLAAASPVNAGVAVALGGGWQAEVDDPAEISFQVDQIGTDFIAIEISKDFTGALMNGVFPSLFITFSQVAPDANTAANIVIFDESVTNQTGTDWTDYHMRLIGGGSTWFDVSASSGFSMAPFTNSMLMDPGGVFGGDPDRATDLWADGGVVADNSSFFPGAGLGELVITSDLSGDDVSFVLEEFPTPEPASLVLLTTGLLAFRRRRRSRVC